MIITVINQKGGVGKTATVQSFAAALCRRGEKDEPKSRVLMVDMDAQCSLTFTTGALPSASDVWDVLFNKRDAGIAAIHTHTYGDIVRGSPYLAASEKEFGGRADVLLDALDAVRDDYDYILVDTPPGLGIVSANCLAASDCVIIPVTSEAMSLQGAYALRQSIETLRAAGYVIDIAGLLVTKYNPRSALARQIEPALRQTAADLGTRVFDTRIRACAPMAAALTYQEDIFTYAPKSNAAADYAAAVEEFLKGLENTDGKA